MPCGCKDKMKIEGWFKMRFVGRPNGKLMKGAKANYVHGQIYSVPAEYSLLPFWEPIDAVPELKVPETTKVDSVYDDAVYIPDDQHSDVDLGNGAGAPSISPVRIEKTKEVLTKITPSDDEWQRHIKEVMNRDAKQGLYHIDVDESVEPIVPKIEEKPAMTRDELKAALDAAGVKYSTRSRTETLAQMVKDLESQ